MKVNKTGQSTYIIWITCYAYSFIRDSKYSHSESILHPNTEIIAYNSVLLEPENLKNGIYTDRSWNPWLIGCRWIDCEIYWWKSTQPRCCKVNFEVYCILSCISVNTKFNQFPKIRYTLYNDITIRVKLAQENDTFKCRREIYRNIQQND